MDGLTVCVVEALGGLEREEMGVSCVLREGG